MNGTQSMPSFRSITIKSTDGHAGPQPLSIPSSIREPVKGISGILYKRVNFGRRWRPRWFVLRDDILSYYKIHGRHKIFVIQEIDKGTKIIGERSLKRLGRLNNGQFQSPRKSFREIHLKVSSIQESKSNKRRFAIFTGTKWLHLRAQAWEDRVAWMEALQTVKNKFPQMSNDELMAPVNSFGLSTEKLHQRLMKEGLNEAAIQDCEQIMRNEFAVLQNQLVLLKQKQSLLIDTLRQLEL